MRKGWSRTFLNYRQRKLHGGEGGSTSILANIRLANIAVSVAGVDLLHLGVRRQQRFTDTGADQIERTNIAYGQHDNLRCLGIGACQDGEHYNAWKQPALHPPAPSSFKQAYFHRACKRWTLIFGPRSSPRVSFGQSDWHGSCVLQWYAISH